MPPKKKKAPKNAFWFFAMEWKAEKEEQGQRFRDLTEVTTLCSDDWKYLPENLRNRYKEMEKKAKQTSKGDTSNKYNSLGVSFDELERQQREERMAEQTMFNYIDATMKKLSISENELKHHFFYLIHVNTYCYWGNIKAHIPCEVAISKFNLDKGVVDWFHVFPAPRTDNADLPVGYKFEAMENAKQVHGIPLPGDWDKNEKDWSKIADDVLEFLTPHNGDEVPPIFTMDGATAGGSNINCEIQAVKDFFDIISDITGKDFRVYSLSLLYFKLYDTCQLLAESLFGDKERAFPVEGVAYNQLTKDIYNYCPGIACQFHETTDMFHNCSLSFVRRWVFLMSEFCCKALRIPLIPGSHCISNADIATPLVLPEVVVPRQPSSHPVSRPLSTQGHLEEQNVFADSRRGRNTAIQSPVTSNNFCANNPVLEECDGPPSEGWSTVARGQSNMRTSRANHQKPSGSNSASPIIIDNSKEPDPAQTRIFRTGQSANCVSEVMPDTAGSSVRLPTTRGRGEVMAEMLRQHQSTPGASFSADDFPAIGGTRPGQLSRPMAKGWGRGFLQQ